MVSEITRLRLLYMLEDFDEIFVFCVTSVIFSFLWQFRQFACFLFVHNSLRLHVIVRI